MRAASTLLTIFALTSCVGPDGMLYPPGNDPSYGQPAPRYDQPYNGNYPPAPYPGAPQSQPPPPISQPRPPARSDYLPHLRDEYQNGHQIGVQDRSYGYPADYRRAFQRYGTGYESYFQEGYADGYNGAPIRH